MATNLSRRQFLGAAAMAVAAVPGSFNLATAKQAPDLTDAASIPIIDTHIHLFDPTRPQGVPWPPKNNPVLYKPALPTRFREVTKDLGIVGAIEVECSPWLEDNQWVLDVAEKDTIMVGTVGNLEPGKPEFARHFERFRKNRLFRGIRYGNLWGHNLATELDKPQFVDDLKRLADAGLVLDTANPNPQLLAAIVRRGVSMVEARGETTAIQMKWSPGVKLGLFVLWELFRKCDSGLGRRIWSNRNADEFFAAPSNRGLFF